MNRLPNNTLQIDTFIQGWEVTIYTKFVLKVTTY